MITKERLSAILRRHRTVRDTTDSLLLEIDWSDVSAEVRGKLKKLINEFRFELAGQIHSIYESAKAEGGAS